MLNRASGLLLNVSSLPSEFGIGGFGAEIDELCAFALKCGFHAWQTLPITMLGQGNSPYSGSSAFALNFLYVSPYALLEKGWVRADDIENCKVYAGDWAVDYNVVATKKITLLKKAFANISQCAEAFINKKGTSKIAECDNVNAVLKSETTKDSDFEISKEKFKNSAIFPQLTQFEKVNTWTPYYAMFMTLSDLNAGIEWWKWDKKYREVALIDKVKFVENNFFKYYYYIFEQFVLSEQWKACRKACARKGVKIIGDMPMYVSLNSADVWSSPSNFLLGQDYLPTLVAGVPPDYFSAEGQLWGNPLYDYKYMQSTNFDWWGKRFDRMFELYDILRIDHFRAFSEYWAVPVSAKTAKDGKWVKGVGMKLLGAMIDKYGAARFIAEDLGIIDEKVEKLLKSAGLSGMRVMQFAFSDGDSLHLPHNFNNNSVAYTATHDNNTTLGWLYSLDNSTRDYVLKYTSESGDWMAGGAGNVSVKSFIKSLLASCAILAIVPFQDLCGFGADCRMNTPGVAEGNWTFRATREALATVDCGYFKKTNDLFGRDRAL